MIDDPRSSRALLVLQYMAGGGLVSRRAIDEATLRRMHPDTARVHFRNIARVMDRRPTNGSCNRQTLTGARVTGGLKTCCLQPI